MRPRWKIVSSGSFCSTFCPSSVATTRRPGTVFAQPGGIAPSAYESKFSVHGSGCATRARASPVSPPTVALMTPACWIGLLATVNDAVGHGALRGLRASTWPFLRAGSGPSSSNESRAQLHRLTGLERPARWATPADTRASPAAGHDGFVGGESGGRRRAAASRSRRSRRSTRRRCGRVRWRRCRAPAPACLPTRSSCWCCSAARPRSGSRPCRRRGRMMKNVPPSVPTKILPSARTGEAFCAVPSGSVHSDLPVSVSKAISVEPLSI